MKKNKTEYCFKILTIQLAHANSQWEKSPKKQSVFLTLWHCIQKRTPSDCFFNNFAHWKWLKEWQKLHFGKDLIDLLEYGVPEFIFYQAPPRFHAEK